MKSEWDSRTERFETRRLPLRHLVPVELLPTKDIRLPAAVSRTRVRPYVERLKALEEAEQIYDMLSITAYDMEKAIPDERLALADRLWFGEGDKGPFITARRAWRRLEDDIERWKESLEAEQAELCRDILRIEKGDIVFIDSQGQMLRIRVDDASVYAYESDVVFRIAGTRFRKDGTLGKRRESFILRVENDLA